MNSIRRLVAATVVFIAAFSPLFAQDAERPEEEHENPRARERYYLEMRAFPFDLIPRDARFNALDQAARMSYARTKGSMSLLSANRWSQVGPFDVAGRVRAIAVNPLNGSTLWIGAANGGVWKSNNGGQSWRPVMDHENAISMGALALDPSDTNVIYAGTGELSENVDSYAGAGIFRSDNGGESWRTIGLTSVGAFSRIVVDPRDRRVILAGATKNNGGFYRTSDGGTTWSRTFELPVSDVTIDPVNPDNVWIGTLRHGLYRSRDNGRTFARADQGIGADGTTLDRISVQVAPSRPSTLYALVAEKRAGGSGGVRYLSRIYKSSNGGDSWSLVYDNIRNFLNSAGFEQGFYNNVIAISPVDPNVVVAGGVDLVWTRDGGNSWKVHHYFAADMHPDQHAVGFLPGSSSSYYLGNDGGMFVTADTGSTFNRINRGLAITQFYDIGVNPASPTSTYGGAQDNGTLSDRSAIGFDIAGSDGGTTIVDYSDTTMLYGQYPEGDIFKWDLVNKVQVTINIGFDDEAAFVSPMIIHPTEAKTLYHGRSKVWKTTSGGEQGWYAVSPTVTGFVSALGISPVDPLVVYAGSNRGTVLVSRDSGTSWRNVTRSGNLPQRAVTDFAPSPSNAATCYISYSGFYTGHVFKTTDHGEHWSDVSATLPDIPVNTIFVHPEDERIVYAGTDIGVFITLDAGVSWMPYSDGLPRVPVMDLEYHASRRLVRAGTFGRSIFEIALETPSSTLAIASPRGGDIWATGSTRVISWSGSDAAVSLDYSLDSGKSWLPIRSGVIGSSFRWSIPDTSSIVAMIRATGGSSVAYSRTFTIERQRPGSVLAGTSVWSYPYGITHDGTYLWATDFNSDTLSKIDPATLEIVEQVKMNLTDGSRYFTDLAYNPVDNTFFIHKLNNATETPGGWLYKVGRDGSELGRWQSICEFPIGLAYLQLKDPDGDYLLVSDRNGAQNIYLYDPVDPNTQPIVIPRPKPVFLGPRGAASALDGKSFYQAFTLFDSLEYTAGSNSVLLRGWATKMDAQTLADSCEVPLNNAVRGWGELNVRGLEIDPTDHNLWVTDARGNIFKIAGCSPKQSTVSVDGGSAPAGVTLSSGSPNPFIDRTSIDYSLASATEIAILVYDTRGFEVARLDDGLRSAGEHTTVFDATSLPAGTYRCVLLLPDGRSLSTMLVHLK